MLMKLRNLLVLGALLFAGSASAAIQERQKPTISPIDVKTDGSTMYMYNVEAQKFFLGANDWSTRASVGDKGYKVFFDQEIAEGEAWNGATIQWRDSVENQSAIKHVFMAADGAMWVDNSGENNRLYDIEPVAGKEKTYRIKVGTALNGLNGTFNAEVNPNSYIGVANLETDTRLYWNLSVGQEGAMLDWQFVTPEGYTAYMDAVGVYNVAQDLKAQIEAAVAEGVDVAAYEAVYNNTAATTEELNAAISAVKMALAQIEEQKVDPMNPISKTSMITNPSYDANNNTGWSGTGPGFQSYDNAEHYNKTFDSWQVVTGLPNGLYKLTVQGFYRPADASKVVNGAVFYAANGTDSLTVAVPDINSATALASKPNNMQSSGDAFHAGHYGTEIYFMVVNNQARIGIKLPELTGGSDWVIWDNWELTYYGNKGEATYAGAVAGMVAANIAKFDGREAEMTTGLNDTYKATLNGLTAADLDALNGAVATIAQTIADMETNIEGWVKYAALINEGNEVRANPSYTSSDAMRTMAAYVTRTAPAILKNKDAKYTNEALQAEIDNLDFLIKEAVFNSLQPNSDVTDRFLINARYDNGTTGWNGSWTAVAYGCMEAYERDWDAYQIVTKAPQGVYEVSLQGFYRVKRGDEAYTMWQNGQQTCPGHVYVNNHLNEVKCVFSEPVRAGEGYIYSAVGTGPESNPSAFVDFEQGDSVFFPNNMQTAGEAFTAGMYVASANGIVAQEGDQLRIGVKGKKQTATWVIWDNFKMIFRGKQIAYTKPYLQEAVAAAEVTLTQAMAKDTKELLQAAKANAEAHLNSEDENAVFDALVQIYAAQDSVAASADLFAELDAKANEVQNAMMIYQASATEAAMAAATDLLVKLMEGQAGNLTKEEAQALLAEVKPVLIELKRPAGVATDETPLDYTVFIESPSFEDESGNGTTTGWTGAEGAANNGAYEFYQKTFDLNQKIESLPNGTYRLVVSAYERIGSSVNDYTLFQAAKDTATVFFYGTSGEDTYQEAVSRISSAAILSNNAFGIEGCAAVDTLKDVEVGADSIYYVPNTMASAVTFFNDYEEYVNELYVEVVDGTLTIGIKKEVQASNDWVMMDNWKLYYLGTESKFKPSSIGSVVLGNGAAVVKREIFTLGGAKVNKLQQGVNIIRNIHADGTVTVKKVIK